MNIKNIADEIIKNKLQTIKIDTIDISFNFFKDRSLIPDLSWFADDSRYFVKVMIHNTNKSHMFDVDNLDSYKEYIFDKLFEDSDLEIVDLSNKLKYSIAIAEILTAVSEELIKA